MIACYIRVSTVGQNEESQVEEIVKWLRGNGIDFKQVRWFVDKSSGDSLKRPQFQKLQKAVFNGSVKTVVVYKLDRLSRKMKDGISLIDDWMQKDIRLVCVSQQFDFQGTVGQLIAAVLLAVGQMEQETRRERQKAGIEAAQKRGKYRKCGRKKGSTKAPVQQAVRMRERGFAVTEIAKALGISRNTCHRYLRDARGLENDTNPEKNTP